MKKAFELLAYYGFISDLTNKVRRSKNFFSVVSDAGIVFRERRAPNLAENRKNSIIAELEKIDKTRSTTKDPSAAAGENPDCHQDLESGDAVHDFEENLGRDRIESPRGATSSLLDEPMKSTESEMERLIFYEKLFFLVDTDFKGFLTIQETAEVHANSQPYTLPPTLLLAARPL